MAYTIRSARTRDVPVIRKLIDANVESGRLLTKATVTLYEDVQEFCVAEFPAGPVPGGPVPGGPVPGGPVPGGPVPGGVDVVGCGALHVMWEDLAEIRTVAVREDCQGLGIGHAIVAALLQRARAVGVNRVFCLTFAVDFFGRHGFQPISGTPVAAEVYQELLRSYDEGVAEFLDLEWVKPNTLGNTRMLLRLLPGLTGPGIQTGINEYRRCARDSTSPPGVPSGKPGGRRPVVWRDLAALTPPLVVCIAFVIGVAMLVRREMSPKRRAERGERRRSPDHRS
jgi:amino-acid N-acetyltransferase